MKSKDSSSTTSSSIEASAAIVKFSSPLDAHRKRRSVRFDEETEYITSTCSYRESSEDSNPPPPPPPTIDIDPDLDSYQHRQIQTRSFTSASSTVSSSSLKVSFLHFIILKGFL